MDNMEMNKEQQLLFDLIFLNKKEYEIRLLEYINDIKHIEEFSEKITSILTQSGIKIKEQVFVLTKDKTAWILKIKR
jgi:hypothetical protein